MPQQKAVALQIKILSGHESDAQDLLRKLGNPSNAERTSPLTREKYPEVHYLRWLIAPATKIKGKEISASVIYSANVDGKKEHHIDQMVKSSGDFLHELFGHCEGYSSSSGNEDDLRSFINSYFIKTPAFYIGAPNRSVDRILKEDELHRAIAKLLNRHGNYWKSSFAAFQAIQKWLASEENRKRFSFEDESSKTPKIYWISALLVGILSLVVLLISAVILFPLVHFLYERRLEPLGLKVNQLDVKVVEEKLASENRVYQNQLSQVFETKPGLRKVVLWINLRMTNLLARTIFVKGQLLGTPTIHFARWLMIDKGKRFVFFSNYDGSYSEYLGDFVDNSGWGLNAIYGASKGYPTTKFVIGGGSYNIGEFLGWGRYTQVETQAWYAAYPNLGLEQIINNSLLRKGLSKPNLSKKKMEKLLRRI